MRNKLVSEKTFCYCGRYVHKKNIPINGEFIFTALNPNIDSDISYVGRWYNKQNYVLDILSDLIYLNTYNLPHTQFPRSFNDLSVFKNCVELTNELKDEIVKNNLPYIYHIKIDKSLLIKEYPYIFNNFTNKQFKEFFTSASIGIKLNYKVKLIDQWFIYEMKNHEKIFNVVEKPIKLKKDGSIIDSEINIYFDTPLGFFFQHNIKSLNFQVIDPLIYECKNSASNFFYKRFVLCKNRKERLDNKVNIELDKICDYFSFDTFGSNRRRAYQFIKNILTDLEKLIEWDEIKKKEYFLSNNISFNISSRAQ